MSMEESVSSLYGPGAIICWLCATLSVLLSWSFNHSSRKYDAVTNDFVASLSLPTIAVGHLIHELSISQKPEGRKATPTMDATFTVCMDFVPAGSMLCFLAFYHRQNRKLVLTAVITVACSVMVLIGFTTDRSKVPHFVNQNALLALIMSGCAVILPFLRVSFDGCFTLRCLSRRSTITLLSSSLLSILPCCGFASYFCADDNCQKVGEKGNKRTVVKGWRFLPQTPYSISEVDQGVALCVGIVTLLLSIRDMIQDYNFSLYDKFEYWRIRCVRNIELGNTNVDVARWKQELDSIDKKAECERTRARHRKRELETWASLPEVKRAYEQYRIAKGLSDSGLL